MIVVYTNVLAYFVLGNARNTQLVEELLRKDSTWAAPILWRSELRNVLSLYVKNKTLDLIGATQKFAVAEMLLTGREFEVETDRILQLADLSGCTAYDCEFVYLAEKLNVHLVTSDKKVLSSFPKIARSMQDFLST